MQGAIKSFNGYLDIAVPIVDVEVYDYNRHDSTLKLIITTSINGTYQNVVFFYDAHLDIAHRIVKFSISEMGFMSSATTSKDTFKVR